MAQRIEITNALFIYTNIPKNVNFIIRDNIGKVLYFKSVEYATNNYYSRKRIIDLIKDLLERFEFNTIVYEDVRINLFTISKYVDPNVFNDINKAYSLKISIEDRFYEIVEYMIAIPHKAWTIEVLNSYDGILLDKCKRHILYTNEFKDYIQDIEDQNLYTALCFSESIKFDNLINKKYAIK